MVCCPVMFAFLACVSSVFYVPVLACAGIGKDLAYSGLFTLSVCSGKRAMTSKKKHGLEVHYINSRPQNHCLQSL